MSRAPAATPQQFASVQKRPTPSGRENVWVGSESPALRRSTLGHHTSGGGGLLRKGTGSHSCNTRRLRPPSPRIDSVESSGITVGLAAGKTSIYQNPGSRLSQWFPCFRGSPRAVWPRRKKDYVFSCPTFSSLWSSKIGPNISLCQL